MRDMIFFSLSRNEEREEGEISERLINFPNFFPTRESILRTSVSGNSDDVNVSRPISQRSFERVVEKKTEYGTVSVEFRSRGECDR